MSTEYTEKRWRINRESRLSNWRAFAFCEKGRHAALKCGAPRKAKATHAKLKFGVPKSLLQEQRPGAPNKNYPELYFGVPRKVKKAYAALNSSVPSV